MKQMHPKLLWKPFALYGMHASTCKRIFSALIEAEFRFKIPYHYINRCLL